MIKISEIKKRFKQIIIPITLGVFLLPASPVVMADAENDMLKQRIEKLEKELNELKALMNKKSADEEKASKPAVSAEKNSKGFSVKPYGYVKLDAAYNDSAVTTGNFVIFVPSEGSIKDDNEFNITARQTRLGLNITAPEYNGWKTTGKVEIDFYGDGSTAHETKAEPMLRHAFLQTSKGDLSFIAGQTWDVISPLNPSTINYPVGWSGGNIGYRRPQVRVSQNNSHTGILTQLALSRTTGLTNENLGIGNKNDGDDSGFPTIQGRMALTTKILTDKNTVLGVSGHYGKEEVDMVGGNTDFTSWSLNMDYIVPLTESLTLSGEIFTGENLDDYFGGAYQGINISGMNEISTKGMWTQLKYQYNPKLQYNLGFGFDNPDNGDINDGNRSKNSFYYLNAMYKVFPYLTLGFEYSYWETDYKNAAEGDANRFQTSATYSF